MGRELSSDFASPTAPRCWQDCREERNRAATGQGGISKHERPGVFTATSRHPAPAPPSPPGLHYHSGGQLQLGLLGGPSLPLRGGLGTGWPEGAAPGPHLPSRWQGSDTCRRRAEQRHPGRGLHGHHPGLCRDAVRGGGGGGGRAGGHRPSSGKY